VIVWEIKLIDILVKMLVAPLPYIGDVSPDGMHNVNHYLFFGFCHVEVNCVNGLCPLDQNASLVKLIQA